MKVEYITDPVLYVPRLRCPSCGSKVRQIREAASPTDSIWAALGEPIAWIFVGIAALFGTLSQAVFALTFLLLFGIPLLVVWLYLRGLKNGQFLCMDCDRQFSFGELSKGKGH